MSDECPGKNSWPELVGKDANYAKSVIERENPLVTAIILPEGSPTTKDFRCDRVWVFFDADTHLVVQVPKIG
eukprot:Gb_25265 [translate_table: standard]